MSDLGSQDSHLPLKFYPPHLLKIAEKEFTPREIDVIACITSGQTDKRIASLLGITEKGVGSHKTNIFRNLNCKQNPKAILTNFIETSGRYDAVRQHYFHHILRKHHFENYLKKLAKQGKESHLNCWIKPDTIYFSKEKKPSFIDFFTYHLKLAGIKILSPSCDSKENDIKFPSTIQTICFINDNFIGHLENDKDLKDFFKFSNKFEPPADNIILAVQNKNSARDFLENNKDLQYVDFSIAQNYYTSFFEVLKKFYPQANPDEILLTTEESVENQIQGPAMQELPKKIPLSLPQQGSFFKNIVKQKKWISISSIICLLIISFVALLSAPFHTIMGVPPSINSENPLIQPALFIPVEESLLKRGELYKDIDNRFKKFKNIKSLALIGPGGSGKTILARKYALSQNVSFTWEINAESKKQLTESMESLAYTLSRARNEESKVGELKNIISEKEREVRIFSYIKETLKNYNKWIIIYDGLKKYDLIKNYLISLQDLKNNGKIIITTEDHNIGNNLYINNTIQVKPLNNEEKLKLFNLILNKSKINYLTDKEKNEFVTNLPPFPLDICIAASYLNCTQSPPERYLYNLKQNDKSFLKIQEDILNNLGEYKKTRYNIVAFSLKEILNKNENFRLLLLLISILGSQEIPRLLLHKFGDSLFIDEFILNLNSYCFINLEDNNNHHLSSSFSIHQSIQQIILAYLKEDLSFKEREKLMSIITSTLKRYIEDVKDEHNTLELRNLIKHCESILSHNILPSNHASLFLKFSLGNLYLEVGDYRNSKHILENLLANFIDHNSSNIKEYARALSDLGISCRSLANYKEAEEWLKKSLDLYKTQPTEYIGMARALSYLGTVFLELSRYKDAEKLLEQSYELYKTHPHKDYKGMAHTLTYLGAVFHKLGKYSKAQEFLEKGLEVYKKYLPDKIQRLAWVNTYIGLNYQETGDFLNAEKTLEDCLSIYREYLPKDHIDLAWVMTYLGDFYRKNKNYKKAKELLEESLNIYQQQLSPPDHIWIAWAQLHLGILQLEIGNNKKAQNLLEESLVAFEKYLPPTHIWIADTMVSLGKVYIRNNEYEKARKQLDRSIFIYKEHLPENHIYIKRALQIRDKMDNYMHEGLLISSLNILWCKAKKLI